MSMEDTVGYPRKRGEEWTEVLSTKERKIFRISQDGLATEYAFMKPNDENESGWEESISPVSMTQLMNLFQVVLTNTEYVTVNASAGPVWEKLASMAVKDHSPEEAWKAANDALSSMPPGTSREAWLILN